MAEFKYGRNKQEKEPSQQTDAQPKSQQTDAQPKSNSGADVIINWEELIPVSGKLELTIKINSLPQVQKVNGVCHFKVECDGRMVGVGLKQKQWTKLETASTTYAEWIAAISGKMGATTADGFVLENANVQVFERKSKAAAQPDAANAEQSDSATPTNVEPSGDTKDVATQTKPERGLTDTESVDAAAKSIAKPEEKPAPKAKPSAEKSEPQPKKVGKFKVQIR